MRDAWLESVPRRRLPALVGSRLRSAGEDEMTIERVVLYEEHVEGRVGLYWRIDARPSSGPARVVTSASVGKHIHRVTS